jgi:hypothetical protein
MDKIKDALRSMKNLDNADDICHAWLDAMHPAVSEEVAMRFEEFDVMNELEKACFGKKSPALGTNESVEAGLSCLKRWSDYANTGQK